MKKIKNKIETTIANIIMPFVSFTSNKLHHKLYINMLYISYFIYFITLTGVITIGPQYINLLENIIKYYICIFLLLRFNPWTYKYVDKEEIEFDRRIAFTSGFFLLFTTTISNIVKMYIHKIRDILQF